MLVKPATYLKNSNLREIRNTISNKLIFHLLSCTLKLNLWWINTDKAIHLYTLIILCLVISFGKIIFVHFYISARSMGGTPLCSSDHNCFVNSEVKCSHVYVCRSVFHAGVRVCKVVYQSVIHLVSLISGSKNSMWQVWSKFLSSIQEMVWRLFCY